MPTRFSHWRTKSQQRHSVSFLDQQSIPISFSLKFFNSRKVQAVVSPKVWTHFSLAGSPLSPPPCVTTTSLPLTCFSSFGSTLCAHLFCPPKKVVVREVLDQGIAFLLPPAPCLTIFMTSVPLPAWLCLLFSHCASPFLLFLPALFRFLITVFPVFP
jgi:hypothetical protein